MKRLTTTVLSLSLAAVLVVTAQDRDQVIQPGPGEVGECGSLDDLELGLSARRYLLVGSSLYEREYREKCLTKLIDLPFAAVGIDVVWEESREKVQLWTGDAIYLYDVKSGDVEEGTLSGFMSTFLYYSITGSAGSEGRYGCFGGSTREVSHDARPQEEPVPSLQHEVRPDRNDGEEAGGSINGVSIDDLTWALRDVNNDPHHGPDLSDLDLDEEDLQRYREAVASDRRDLEGKEETDFATFHFGPRRSPTMETIEIYENLPAILDTLDPATLRAALVACRDAWSSTSSSSYMVTLTNERSDTLRLSFRSSGPKQPFRLPWTIHYNDVQVRSYSIELARLLMPLLPDGDAWDEGEEKVNLLYGVAWYLGGEVGSWQIAVSR